MGPRLHRFVQNLAMALGPLGIILFSLSVFATENNYTGQIGFPFAITRQIPGCFGPGGPLECLAYDPLGVALDYLFWAGLSVITLTLAGWVRNRSV